MASRHANSAEQKILKSNSRPTGERKWLPGTPDDAEQKILKSNSRPTGERKRLPGTPAGWQARKNTVHSRRARWQACEEFSF